MSFIVKFFQRIRAAEAALPRQPACRPTVNPYIEPEKRKQAIQLICGGAVAFAGICLYRGDEKFYRQFVSPILRLTMDAETAHRFAIRCASMGLLPAQRSFPDPPLLSVEVFGRKFSNPIGLAAGFDKDAECYQNLFKLGFGFVEVGSVTPLPQEGNEKPRIFRLASDEAIVNRCGFNSAGHDVVLKRVSLHKSPRSSESSGGLLGVNLGKNKDAADAGKDFAEGVRKFAQFADYLVINVSSPNTPGLRALQSDEHLSSVLAAVKTAKDEMETKLGRKVPLAVKVSPDLNGVEISSMAQTFVDKRSGVDAIIVSNTTTSRDGSLSSPDRLEAGGLSGKPLRDLATATISSFYAATKGQVPIIGVGGVFTGDDAYAKIRAGASLVQIYTAMVYHGPGVVAAIKARLEELLSADGFVELKDAVGADHRKAP